MPKPKTLGPPRSLTPRRLTETEHANPEGLISPAEVGNAPFSPLRSIPTSAVKRRRQSFSFAVTSRVLGLRNGSSVAGEGEKKRTSRTADVAETFRDRRLGDTLLERFECDWEGVSPSGLWPPRFAFCESHPPVFGIVQFGPTERRWPPTLSAVSRASTSVYNRSGMPSTLLCPTLTLAPLDDRRFLGRPDPRAHRPSQGTASAVSLSILHDDAA